LQNDDYAHKIKEIISFKEDDYEILLYFNFYILLVETQVPSQSYYFKLLNMCKFAHDRKTLKLILIIIM